MRHLILTVSSVLLLAAMVLPAQERDRDDRGPRRDKLRGGAVASILDLAYADLNVNQFRNHATNIGEFYPVEGIGLAGEWPKDSGNETIYRMNVMVAVPDNVVHTISGAYEEWNPRGGYFNPDNGLLPISTDDSSWPVVGGSPRWPIRDDNGEPIFISQQDSYAVFDDSSNALATDDPSKLLEIEMHQTSYAWNTSFDEDYVVFKEVVLNRGSQTFDSLYLGIYFDPDAGGFDDWDDDLSDFDPMLDFAWVYDSDNATVTSPWQGDPFPIGITMLETPTTTDGLTGITSWHIGDGTNAGQPIDIDQDAEAFGVLAADPGRVDPSEFPNLFYGDNPRFDDPSLISPQGVTNWIGSGPYALAPGDSLTFYFAVLAGSDLADLYENVNRAREVFAGGFTVKTVPQPEVSATATGGEVELSWPDEIDNTYIDPYTGTNTLLGYRVYRTEDPTRRAWTEVDDILVGESPYYNPPNGRYTWSDSAVLNGFYYSYAVTAYDASGDESGIANLSDGSNVVEVRPAAAAAQDGEVEGVRVVPNPFVISASWERERLGGQFDGEPLRELAFQNVPPNCTVRIYTLDADHVRTLRHNGPSGTLYWDLRSDANMLVTSGVYFFHVEADGNEHIGKFAIIR